MSDQNQNQSRRNQPPDHEGTGYASHPLAGTAAGTTEPAMPSTAVAGQVGLSPTDGGSTGHAGTGSASHPLAGTAPGAGTDEEPETERGGGGAAAHSSSRINEDEDGTGS